MPIYPYECTNCLWSQDEIMSIHEELPIVCPRCGSKMKRVLHSNFGICMGAAGAYGYYDDNLETYIHSNSHRRQVMREKGVCEKGDTPKPDGDAWV